MKAVALLALIVVSATSCGSSAGEQVIVSPTGGSPSTEPAATITESAAPTTSAGVGLSGDERAVVVASVVARTTTYNSFGGVGHFDLINVVDRFGTGNGFLEVAPTSPPIDATTRRAIEQALAPAHVVWVSSRAEVIGTDQSIPSYEDVGAIVTIGKPSVSDATAEIVTALWCGGTCGIGGAFTLARAPSGEWSVVGPSGQQWMS